MTLFINRFQTWLKWLTYSGLIVVCILLGTLPGMAQSAAIQGVRYDSSQQMVTIFSNNRLAPQIRYIDEDNRPRIIVDLPDSMFQQLHQVIEHPSPLIDKIRISQFSSSPPMVRMVFDLLQNTELKMKSESLYPGQFRTEFRVGHNRQGLAAATATPQRLANLPVHKLKDIQIRQNNLYLVADGPLYPEIRRSQQDAKSYYLVLYNFETHLRGNLNLSSPYISNVRISGNIQKTEIAFQLTKREVEIVPFSEGNTCTIQFFSRANTQAMAQIQDIDVFEMSQDVTRIRVHASKGFDFQIYPLNNPDRLVLDTLGTVLPEGAKERPIISSNLKKIRFAALGADQKSNVRVVFDLKDEVSFQYSNKDGRVLELILQSKQGNVLNEVRSNRKAFVILDAGHGGNDPGAIGKQGLREKDVTLAVSEYLQRYLENDQFKVILSRDNDSEILLQPRVDVANQKHADLFISVHCNSMPPGNPHIKGIETYYTTPQSLELANILHRRMVGELQTPDRGVRKRNLFVTRKTVMPSVLLEIGFVSNPAEEALLGNPNYQRRVARTIYNGIQEYLLLQERKSRKPGSL